MMSEEIIENPQDAESSDDRTRLVPVAESIKYRRRAQQAESRLQEVEQQLGELQAQLDKRVEEIASAEAQRDEARQQVTLSENRLAAERLLNEAGVADLETALLLLSKKVDLSDEIDREDLTRNVERLLLDKPILRAVPGSALPPKTSSARSGRDSATARLTQVAERASRTGNRRDVAEYLRLRRQMATQ